MGRPYHKHPIFRISSVARPVDARYPTNKAVLVLLALAVVAGAAWGWWDGVGVGGAALRGLAAAATVFGTWALGREVDPDHNATAFVAVALVLGPFVMLGGADLWTLLTAVVLTRIVNRTVGPPARVSDLAGALLMTGAAIFVSGRWTLGIALMVAMALDASMPKGRPDRWAFAAAGGALVVAFHFYVGITFVVPSYGLALGAVVLATIVAAATMPAVTSAADLPGNEIVPRRVLAAVAVPLVVVVLAQFESGELQAVGVAAALVAMLPGRLIDRLRRSVGEEAR